MGISSLMIPSSRIVGRILTRSEMRCLQHQEICGRSLMMISVTWLVCLTISCWSILDLETNKRVSPIAPTIMKTSLMRQDSKSRWENGWMFPRRWMLPALNTDFPSNMDIFKDKDNEVIRVKEDETKMEVSLDTSQYRPDELKVMVNDGVLTVEGNHEEKAEDGSKMVSRMFSRKYTLPPAAKSEEVVSNLSSDGVLVITTKEELGHQIRVRNALIQYLYFNSVSYLISFSYGILLWDIINIYMCILQ